MTSLTVVADRGYASFSPKSSLSINVDNIDGDQSLSFELPSTFGDCVIYGCHLSVASIATVVANPELLGVRFYIRDPSGAVMDVLGSTRWSKLGASALQASLELIHSRLWRTQESLVAAFQEVDTNATPTGDLVVFANVVRVRSS